MKTLRFLLVSVLLGLLAILLSGCGLEYGYIYSDYYPSRVGFHYSLNSVVRLNYNISRHQYANYRTYPRLFTNHPRGVTWVQRRGVNIQSRANIQGRALTPNRSTPSYSQQGKSYRSQPR